MTPPAKRGRSERFNRTRDQIVAQSLNRHGGGAGGGLRGGGGSCSFDRTIVLLLVLPAAVFPRTAPRNTIGAEAIRFSDLRESRLTTRSSCCADSTAVRACRLPPERGPGPCIVSRLSGGRREDSIRGSKRGING